MHYKELEVQLWVAGDNPFQAVSNTRESTEREEREMQKQAEGSARRLSLQGVKRYAAY